MRRFSLGVALAIGLIVGLGRSKTCAADCPQYLVLQPLYSGQATAMPAHAYAYGWFGATPHSASSWYRNYSGTGLWWTYTPGW